MDLAESLLTALDSLGTNKLRAILTMLGVIIGVAAVIALLAVGDGVSASIEDQIQGLGSNVITIVTEFDHSGGYQALSMADVAAITDPLLAPAVEAAAASVQGTQQVVYRGRELHTGVYGVTANHFDIRNIQAATGSVLIEGDVDTYARVAVLGANVAENLFPDHELSIGKGIKIGGVKYEVIGVLMSKGGIGQLNYDDRVFIPLTTAQVRLYTNRTRGGEPVVHSILAQATEAQLMDQAVQQIETVLRDQHDISYEADDDFYIVTQADILDAMSAITDMMTVFLGAIAGISLLVGGIGIMNVMLVSVTERTREIGIRKAVGALKRDILVQFLIESLVISTTGGVLGIALGIGASVLIGNAVTDLTPMVNAGNVLMSLGSAVAVGLVCGIYPAWRAANLRPIEALRYE